ncbi:neutral/alkaline ceramidase [Streptomyces sp. NPDC005574]|uniref:neutral/alkaline ceramidase n=1 Tax=Streptomyces sp. NPDC005574 TaxID=3156891 RepID=UPI0033B431BD
MSRRRLLAGLAGLSAAPHVVNSVGSVAAQGEYLVGSGISDVTGPAAENGMMGYSLTQQKTTGIHLRCRARAYVVVDSAGKRVVFVTADLAAIFQSVHQGVLARLTKVYGGLYTEQNVLLNATHTHSACGGDSHYALYNLSILGFQEQTYNGVVAGVVEAIGRAHNNLAPGSMLIGRTALTDASANRSLVAFDRNPAEDKAQFPLAIDPAVTVLRFRQGGRDIGAISWFATHGTSMTGANRLISGDNKGYAAYAWEHDYAGVRYLDGPPGFVASFPQTNSGDVTPNLNLRPGSGPTENEFENTRIIGDRQFRAALHAFGSAVEQVTGGVDSRLRYVDMSTVTVAGQYTPDGRPHSTCKAAIGTSTLAGSTEDGPGIPIPEGAQNPLVQALGGLEAPIPQALADAQAPKIVVLPTGIMQPYPWTPDILPLQIVRIGQLHLIAGPAEYTIVAGLRLRQTVAAELGIPLENVLVQGYANAYSQYVTTPEEYDSQHYEGGSTLFGRYTLPAYQQEFAKLANALRTGTFDGPGPVPRDLSASQLNFQTSVVFDDPAPLKNFGDVLTQPRSNYHLLERVTVVFVTGHPKNNPRRGGTFLEVQRLTGGQWTRHADDGDWATKYRWTRTLGATSSATITWDIPADTPTGTYRITHHGNWKNGLTGHITPLNGTSHTFAIT